MQQALRKLAIGAIGALLAVVVSACSSAGAGDPGAETAPPDETRVTRPAPSEIAVESVLDGLSSPLYVTGRPGDDGLYVVQQNGVVRVFRDGVEAEPFLDVTDLTASGGERGLLGLAFHPEHADNGLVYVNYTDQDGTTKVVEYRAPSGRPADTQGAREILSVEQPFANHNGGHLAFGTDGMLYIGLGDGGSGGDPEDHGQRLDTLLGSMLRIDVDGRDPGREYAIPADNPFVSRDEAQPEIWALGLRNPWRYSFDAQTGYLWIADVGQNEIEEINRVLSTEGAGSNFGWNRFEGDAPFDDQNRDVTGGPATPPVAQYDHSQGCSVTGGYVVRGDAVPGLDGRYVYGDFCSGRVWAMNADGETPGRPEEITETIGGPIGGLRSFGVDNAGTLYAVTGDEVLAFRAG